MTSVGQVDLASFDDATTRRFWSKVLVGSEEECWAWTGQINTITKRGRFFMNRANRGAAQISLLLAGNARPEGIQALHRCDNPNCVNPKHLYWGTRQQNAIDAVERGQHWNARKDTCKRGHPFTPENTYRKRGAKHRQCRECRSLSRGPTKRKDDLAAAEQRGYERAIAEVEAWLEGVRDAWPTDSLLWFIGDPLSEECRELANRFLLAVQAGQHKPTE